MKYQRHNQPTGAVSRRMLRASGAILALLMLPLAFSGGCSEDVQKQFRTGAGAQLETGLKAILDGVVTGIFTVVNPADNSNSSSSSTTTTTGG